MFGLLSSLKKEEDGWGGQLQDVTRNTQCTRERSLCRLKPMPSAAIVKAGPGEGGSLTSRDFCCISELLVCVLFLKINRNKIINISKEAYFGVANSAPLAAFTINFGALCHQFPVEMFPCGK